jgi:alginate O-acetyltransferase complex protein AlgI
VLFNSLHFVVFFLVVSMLYFALPHRFRWQLLLAASCYFYMIFLPIYILILGFTIVVDYIAGLYIEKTEGSKKKLFLILSLIANIGVLAIFKYFNFLNENLSIALNQVGYDNVIPNLSILLPVGLSFHTFQAMSYTIEVYRGNQKAEKHFGIYALYVMFYPQLVAGPIERPQNILHQFYEKHKFSYVQVTTGLRLMAWGFFKKVVIADRLAVTVNTVYNNPTDFQGLPLILATVFFAFQIYCDFSGYSDIAIGSARVMGFDLMKNFNRPYLSQSVSEFWKRWHISLSTWFRDYLYIPLGGNRVSMPRMYVNLFITFLVSGLWHGANWTYVIWGGLNGLFLVCESMIKKYVPAFASVFTGGNFFIKFSRTALTFGLICLTWVFFRANSVGDAIYIITHMCSNFRASIAVATSAAMGFDAFSLSVLSVALCILFGVELAQNWFHISTKLNSLPVYLRLFLYSVFLVFILLFGVFDAEQQFIYFQF